QRREMGPKIRPAATTIAQVSPAARLNTIASVKAMHKVARAMTRVVLAPSGKTSAVIKRDPMKASQNNDNRLAALVSLTPLLVIKVVDQAATEASIGTWQKNARQQSHTIGSENRIARPPATLSVIGVCSIFHSTPKLRASGTAANAARTRKVRCSRTAR